MACLKCEFIASQIQCQGCADDICAACEDGKCEGDDILEYGKVNGHHVDKEEWMKK